MGNITLGLIICYFITVLLIGYFSGRKEKSEDFLLANRNLGLFSLTATIVASIFSANAVISLTSFYYQYGISVIRTPIAFMLGFIILAFLATKIKRFSDKNKAYTFGDFFYKKYNKQVGILISSILLFCYLGYIVTYFIAGGLVLSNLIGIGYVWSVLIMGIIVLIYLLFGGFKAVVKTDIFQYILILLLAILSFAIFNKQGISFSTYDFFSAGPINIFGFFVYGIVTMVMAIEIWQRIYAGRSIKIVKKSLIISGITYFILSSMVILIAISTQIAFPDIDPNNAILMSLQNLLPQYLFPLGLVVLFSVIMSSIDTNLFVISSNFVNDILYQGGHIESKKNVSMIKIWILIFGIIVMLLAIFFSNLLEVITVVAGLLFSVFPSVLFSFWYTLKKGAIFLSILGGIFVTILAYIFLGITIENTVIGLPIALILLGIYQLITILLKKKKELSVT